MEHEVETGFIEISIGTILNDDKYHLNRFDKIAYMGGCQNDGPFLGTLNIRGRSIIGIQKSDHNFDNHSYVVLQLYKEARIITLASIQVAVVR